MAKNEVGQVVASALVTTFWVIQYITSFEVGIFSLNLDYMGIKRRRILYWFQKYKLCILTKCTYKKLFQKPTFLVKVQKGTVQLKSNMVQKWYQLTAYGFLLFR
jgi:hypothetical protein